MNDEAGRVESVSTTGVVEVGGDANGKTISLNLTLQDTKVLFFIFFEDRVKTDKDTLSEGVIEKDTRTGFGIEFMGRIGTQLRKT